MENRDDNHYIGQVILGETAAFAPLVNRYKDLVFTIAMNITRNREDAEEVAQDVFLKAFQKLAGFRKESSFPTWLYRIAYNESISKVRKNRIKTLDLEEEIMEIIPDEEVEEEIAGLDEQEQKQVIIKILDKLPEIDRVLVTLFYLNNQPITEISEVTGLGESNVKVRLHRVRKKIYLELQELLKMRSLRII
ncbi:MAG: sigma-70 family RNA polymerase sigma factor [Bacteroidales bacterium]|nr:sigma-70 family RNA polymerase sigma factor [Bacteroidales bacterium]